MANNGIERDRCSAAAAHAERSLLHTSLPLELCLDFQGSDGL